MNRWATCLSSVEEWTPCDHRWIANQETISVPQKRICKEIIGNSPQLLAALDRMTKVAPTDATVLITGETGTGKELMARAIHEHSGRTAKPFVAVNCSAIPSSLIASELFGHEKGAFTGALQRRIGRFELAHGGTVFLDEIGELPAETQLMLLRVLQEREFERIGGERSVRVDVRVVAATNRNLRSEINEGRFRKDLFYRLSVFPLEIPPLRERKGDILKLAEYFVERHSAIMHQKPRKLSQRSDSILQSYSWPGNIRELQNVIERALILCDTDLLNVDESWLSSDAQSMSNDIALNHQVDLHEKEIIEKALAECNGRVSGPTGAASKLGVPATTLDHKIKSLNIKKHHFKVM